MMRKSQQNTDYERCPHLTLKMKGDPQQRGYTTSKNSALEIRRKLTATEII